MLLEKKIILIEQDTSDMAVVMQTLITLIQPFKWQFTMISNLPMSLIEALEAPTPFLIGIQKNLWDQKCKVQMMDNIKEENYVIFDLDLQETRGLTDIYDPESQKLQDINFPKQTREWMEKRFRSYLEYKDELIGQLTQGKKDIHQGDRLTSTGRNSPKNPYTDDISLKRSINDQNSLRELNRSPLSREGGAAHFDDIVSKISGYGSQKASKMSKRDKVYSHNEAENLFWVFFW